MTPREPRHGAGRPAVALWQACGLIRPWNDADRDFALALSTASSTILGRFLEDADASGPRA